MKRQTVSSGKEQRRTGRYNKRSSSGKEAEFAESELVRIGSIFKHSPLFRETYAGILLSRYPCLRFPEGNRERTPAHGAALLACKLFTDGVSDLL